MTGGLETYDSKTEKRKDDDDATMTEAQFDERWHTQDHKCGAKTGQDASLPQVDDSSTLIVVLSASRRRSQLDRIGWLGRLDGG